MNANDSVEQELLDVTQRLLDAIAVQEWTTYEQICDPSLSCFEPEACGHLVEGLAFHRFYFDREAAKKPARSTICSPHVRVMGEVAIVSYNRLIQSQNDSGQPVTSATQETRVWHRVGTGWRLVHFHRS